MIENLTQIGSGWSQSSLICLLIISRSLSNERSKNTNSENFQHHPNVGKYCITFLAYALQF